MAGASHVVLLGKEAARASEKRAVEQIDKPRHRRADPFAYGTLE
jgi:hypothetical protein